MIFCTVTKVILHPFSLKFVGIQCCCKKKKQQSHFSVVFTLIDHQYDVIKCPKLQWKQPLAAQGSTWVLNILWHVSFLWSIRVGRPWKNLVCLFSIFVFVFWGERGGGREISRQNCRPKVRVSQNQQLAKKSVNNTSLQRHPLVSSFTGWVQTTEPYCKSTFCSSSLRLSFSIRVSRGDLTCLWCCTCCLGSNNSSKCLLFSASTVNVLTVNVTPWLF